ncbi:MAG: TPM domain-containing protein, partial [Bacteroidia bacterium]|nr:TPM domain-containing protein [Bacteroidia bacterium]MDW8335120.1 TPM domain-containing protein [Bacteroidia bacterium]
GVLSQHAVYTLNVLCDSLERTQNVQCAVVVVRSIGDAVPKTFAGELLNRWGIGSKEKDSGLLLLVVMDQRRAEIETGYGLEEFLPDAVCVRLLQEHLVPKFKAGLYDEGVVEVVNALGRRLAERGASVELDGMEAETQHSKPWTLYLVFMGFYALVAFLTWNKAENARRAWRFQNGLENNVSKKEKRSLKAKKVIVPPLPRFGLALVLTPFPALMSLTFFAADNVDASTLWGGLILFGYFSLLFAVLVNRIYRTLAIYKHYGSDPYVVRQKLTQDHSLWWLTLVFFLPVFALYYIIYWIAKRRLRAAPRNGPKTGLPMRRLSEQEEDQYLSPGQQKEEQLRSVDYDVWVTPNGEEVTILRYPSFWSVYEDCPECKHKTRSKSTTTLVRPTYTSSGTGQTVYLCRFCGHQEVKTFVIPKLEYSSSGS